MTTWAVIPVKSLHRAKSRLAPVLDVEQRAALARRLFCGTITAAVQCSALSGVLVVTPSDELRAIARDLGARVVPEPASGRDAMNTAIAAGCAAVSELGGAGALVLPTDLPLLSAEVIAEFLDEAGDAPVAIAPDREGTGTNVLLLRPPLAIAPAFGYDSYRHHQARAREQGLAVATIGLPALAFDLDAPADLATLGMQVSIPAELGCG